MQENSAPSDLSLSEEKPRYANEILKNVALRSVGIIDPQKSKSLNIEYVPGIEYSDQMAFRVGSIDNFEDILLALDMQTEGLPAFKEEILCEYVVNYKFISERVSTIDSDLRVGASCKSISRVGRQHMKAFCIEAKEFARLDNFPGRISWFLA